MVLRKRDAGKEARQFDAMIHSRGVGVDHLALPLCLVTLDPLLAPPSAQVLAQEHERGEQREATRAEHRRRHQDYAHRIPETDAWVHAAVMGGQQRGFSNMTVPPESVQLLAETARLMRKVQVCSACAAATVHGETGNLFGQLVKLSTWNLMYFNPFYPNSHCRVHRCSAAPRQAPWTQCCWRLWGTVSPKRGGW